ncbi:hypothetical protein, partial [Halalkalibacter lacteus]|uniref:hypothetical protein n=1 Tax=Halalkalibacter lacteus TaxID=3090663 RepID=UPI002FC83BE2
DLHKETGITEFFLQSFERLISFENQIKASNFDDIENESLLTYKKSGFADEWLATVWGVTTKDVSKKRIELNIKPSVKMVDTCAGEFTASTA